MKKLLLLFFSLLTIGISSATAADKTFTATVKGATATLSDNSTKTFGDADVKGAAKASIKSVSFGQDAPIVAEMSYNSPSTYAAYYANGNDLRIYAKNTLTLKGVNGNKIKKLVFTMTTSSSKWSNVTVSPGSGEATLDDNKNVLFYTWNAPETGAVSEVSFTPGKQFTFKSFEVTYEEGEGGGDEPSELTLSGKYGENAVADGATVTVDKGTEFTFTASEAAMFTLDGEALNTEAATTATWTATELCADKAVTVTATAGEKSASLAFTLTVNDVVTPPTPPAGESMTATWTINGVEKSVSAGEKVDVDLKKSADSAMGIWHALAEDSYANTLNKQNYGNVAQLGKGANKTSEAKTFIGTLTLLDSEIPANAVINEISFTGFVKKNSVYKIQTSVNGVDVAKEIVLSSNDVTKITLSDLELNGNSIVFNVTEGADYLAVAGISVKYTVPQIIEMPEYVYDETTQVVELTCKDGHKLWVAEEDAPQEENQEAGASVREFAPMAAEAATDHAWAEANNGEQSHKIYVATLQADKLVYAKAVNKETGNESDVLFIRVNTDGTISGVEGVAVDAAVGEEVYYDLQGRRVAAPAAGGLYIRVMGGKAEKVAIR